MGFFLVEYYVLSCSPAEDLLKPGIESLSPALQVSLLPLELPGKLRDRVPHELVNSVFFLPLVCFYSGRIIHVLSYKLQGSYRKQQLLK